MIVRVLILLTIGKGGQYILALFTLKEMLVFVKQNRESVKDISEDLSIDNKPNFYIITTPHVPCLQSTDRCDLYLSHISSRGYIYKILKILKHFGQRKYEIL